MMNQEKILSRMVQGCWSKPGLQTELSAENVLYEVTKFNGEGIFQNLSERRFRIKARVIKQARMGEAAAEGLLDEVIDRTIAKAIEAAERGRPMPAGYHFPESSLLPGVKTWFEETAGFSPMERAARIKMAVKEAAAPGIELSGSLHLSETTRFVANTSGMKSLGETTEINLNYIAESATSRAHAGQACRDLIDLKELDLAREAVGRCLEAQNPQELPPGEYEAIFLPNALADLTPFLGMLVFSALADQERRSYISGRLGEPLFSPLVDIWDDATDPRGLAEPFDAEGVAKNRIELVKAGVPQGFVHDSLTAASAGVETTGHAFPATSAVYGPIPAHLFFGPGNKSLKELISEMERGVLVSRLHYVRCLEAASVRVGGVTGDGAFLVERGRIVGPVRQMRFSESIMDLLRRVDGVGREWQTVRRQTQGPGPVSIYPSAFTLPAVKVESLGLTAAG
ncbi:MAG: metallopeptidase TldD-related protein [Thermodesulfobacteriota bacterium]